MATTFLPPIDITRASLPPISAILGAMKAEEACGRGGPMPDAKPWKYVSADCHKPSSVSPPSTPQFPTADRETSPPKGLVLNDADFNKISAPKLEATTSNLPGKRWKQKRDQKYGLVGNDAVFARLRVSLQGLERAIPMQSKAVLVTAIQQYLKQEVSPEQFAESIQTLVDEFNVVVPTGPADDAAAVHRPVVSETRKRAADDISSTLPPLRSKPAKKSKVQESRFPKREEEREVAQSAWDALISVCARM